MLFVNRDFRQLFLADSLSQVGTQVVVLGLPLVALTVLRASTLQVGLLTACGTLPLVITGLVAGAWVDRLRRRNVMLFCDLVRAVMLGSIPISWALGTLTIAQLYAVALLSGTASVFFDVAYNSYVPYLVERDRIVEGNAALQTVGSVASTAGPGVSGGVVQALNAPFAMLVPVGGYLWSMVCVLLIKGREPKVARATGRNLAQEIRAGLRFVLGHRLLRLVMASSANLNVFASISGVTLLVFMAKELRLSPSAMGILFTCTGLGGLIGGLTVAWAVRRFGQGPVVCTGAGLLGVPVLLEPLAEPDWRLGMLGAILFVTAFGGAGYNITVLSFRQATTPPEMLGRVNSSARVVVAGMMPLGNLVGGALSDAFGPRTTLLIAGAGASMSFVLLCLSPIRRARELHQITVGDVVGRG